MTLASVFNPLPKDAPIKHDAPESNKVGTEIVQVMDRVHYANSFGVDNVFAGTQADYVNHTSRNEKRLQRDGGETFHRDMMERDFVADDNIVNVDGLKKNERRHNRVVNDMKNASPYSRSRINKDNLSRQDKRQMRRYMRHERFNRRMPQFAKEMMWDTGHMLKGNTYAERKADLDNRFEHMFKLKEEMTGKNREDIKKYEEYKALNKVYQRQLQGIVCGWVDEMCSNNDRHNTPNADFSFRGSDFSNHRNHHNRHQNTDSSKNYDNKYDFNRMQDSHFFDNNFDSQFSRNIEKNVESNFENRFGNDSDRTGVKKFQDAKFRGDIRLPDERFRENYETRVNDGNNSNVNKYLPIS